MENTDYVANEHGGYGFPFIRTQVDGKQDMYSIATGIDCRGSKDMARQEFKDEADVNKLLGRYGVGPIPQRAPVFGEVDMDMGLQDAYHAMDAAKEAYRTMPKEVRERYANWWEMLAAIERGELRKEPPKPAAEVSSEGDTKG